nr:Plug domain-containing protein [Allomuricauda sp.]
MRENLNPIVSQVTSDSLLFWREQIVLHTNKTSVVPKDHLFFKAFVLLGPQQFRSSVSNVLKVELLDENGKLVKNQYHKIIDGTSEGSMEIPKKMEPGNYYLRAYTRWMLNYGPEHFEVKKIQIGAANDVVKPKDKNEQRITFFPEGGQLISGMTNRVLVKIDQISSANLTVVNSKNQVVALIKNYGNGIGSFLFAPQKNEMYTVRLNDDQRIPLPKIQDIGYAIQASNLGKKSLLVQIERSPELTDQVMYLKGKANGITYFEKEVDFEGKSIADIQISKSKMPKGIIHLQLENEFEETWAARPFYVDATELEIELEPISLQQKRAAFKVKVTDGNGNPVQTEVSISLTGENNAKRKNDHAKGLVSSKMSFRNQRYLNDLLLLTGQFSEYGFKGSTETLPNQIRYAFQKGLDFYGQAYDLNGSLLTNTAIQAMMLSKDEVVVEEIETNSEGLFKLEGFLFEGEINMVFRTAGEEPNTKFVQVIPFEYEIPPLIFDKNENDQDSLYLPKLRNPTNVKNVVDLGSIKEADDKLVSLDGVTLVQKKEFKKITPSLYNLKPSKVIYQDEENPRTIPQLFLGIPGFQVDRLGDLYPQVSLLQSSGVGPLLWVVDGLPLVKPTSLVQIINVVNYTDIERIEILAGPEASIYGSRAAGGAVIIYTRNGADKNYIARKEAQLNYRGYHESYDFVEYKKSTPRKIRNVPGMPTTLYWNPVLKTNENGEATVQFSKPESIETIYLNAKVISVKGKRGSAEVVWPLVP